MTVFLDDLAAVVGAANVITAEGDLAPYLTDWRGRYRGEAQAVVRPGSPVGAARHAVDHSIDAVRRRFGRTDLEVTAFAFGTAPIGNIFREIDEETAAAIARVVVP